jgi:hypothetical protein
MNSSRRQTYARDSDFLLIFDHDAVRPMEEPVRVT